MRIAIDYSPALNQRAGIGRFTRGLVDGLAAIDRTNQYTLLYARPNSNALLHFPDAPNFARRELRINERGLTILWQRLRVPMFADWVVRPIDLFHAPDFVLPPLRRARGILTVHDLAFLLHPETAHHRLREYLLAAVPRSVRRADVILADSENTRNDVICLIGARPERVEVVPGGVEAYFRPPPPEATEDLRRRLGLHRPFLLSVGLIEPRKNLVRLIRAFGLLKKRLGLPHELALAGKRGWLSDEIYEAAARSPYAGDIRFLGFVPDSDLPALYAAADCFAYPSLYEGFGLPPLEAMACGAPVVTSNTSSLPEVVGDAGLMVDPLDEEALANAIERVLVDRGLRADLSRRGRERAARFTWEAAARKLLEVYERALGR